MLGLGDIIRRGSGGDGTAFGLDVRGPAELRAEQSAIGSGAQRGDRQRGLDRRVSTDPGLVTDTVAVCQQQAAAAEQVRADRDGGERGPPGLSRCRDLRSLGRVADVL